MEKRLLMALALIFIFLSLQSRLCDLSVDGMLFKGHSSETLYAAAKSNNLERSKSALREGRAMVDTRGSSSDNTPLMEAAKNGNLELVIYLTPVRFKISTDFTLCKVFITN